MRQMGQVRWVVRWVVRRLEDPQTTSSIGAPSQAIPQTTQPNTRGNPLNAPGATHQPINIQLAPIQDARLPVRP